MAAACLPGCLFTIGSFMTKGVPFSFFPSHPANLLEAGMDGEIFDLLFL
jgi:hypothetical protein